MKISIHYCGTCNYRPIAARLAYDIERETGFKAELVHSTVAGILDVSADGVLLHSKQTSGAFPDSKTVIEKIKTLHGS